MVVYPKLEKRLSKRLNSILKDIYENANKLKLWREFEEKRFLRYVRNHTYYLVMHYDKQELIDMLLQVMKSNGFEPHPREFYEKLQVHIIANMLIYHLLYNQKS